MRFSISTPSRALALVLAIAGGVAIGMPDASAADAPSATAASTAASTAPAATGAPVSVASTATSATGAPASAASTAASATAAPASAASVSPAAPRSSGPLAGQPLVVQPLTLPSATAAGAAYLVSQLVDGDHLSSPYGPDYGLTADLGIALASADSQDAALARVAGYLRAHVADYADPAGTGSFPGPFSGAVGKLALLAEITGQDPTSFGGFNLLSTLTSHVCTAADSAGSCTEAGDFYQSYSGISQALAVLALARAGVTPPAATITRLQQLQCTDGGFSSDLIAPGAACTSDVDTTSYALQALTLVAGTQASISQADSYLLAAQQSDGGFIGAAGENADSTGLAAQALIAAGQSSPPLAAASAVASAQAFLVGLQNSDGGFGISAALPASDTRASSQAVPGLAGTTLPALADQVTPVTPAAPTSSAPAHTTSSSAATPAASVAVTGPAPEPATVSAVAAASDTLAATGTTTSRQLLLALLALLAGAGALLVGRPRSAAGRRH